MPPRPQRPPKQPPLPPGFPGTPGEANRTQSLKDVSGDATWWRTWWEQCEEDIKRTDDPSEGVDAETPAGGEPSRPAAFVMFLPEESSSRARLRESCAWLGTPGIGPTGDALSWDLFAHGVAVLCGALRDSSPGRPAGALRALQQWLVWHGNGIPNVLQAGGQTAAGGEPWRVWKESQSDPDKQERLIGLISSSLGMTAAGYDPAEHFYIEVLLANTPLAPLGVKEEKWPDLVQVMEPVQRLRKALAQAWASEADIEIAEIGGFLRQWMTPCFSPAADPATQHVRALTQLQWSRRIMAALYARTDWTSEAIETLQRQVGGPALRQLNRQARFPLQLVRGAIKEAERIIQQPDLLPSGELTTMGHALLQALPLPGDTPQHDRRMGWSDEDRQVLRTAFNTGLSLETAIRQRVSTRSTGFREGIETGCRTWHGMVGDALACGLPEGVVDKSLHRRLLKHPSRTVRAAAIGHLGAESRSSRSAT